MSAGKKKRAVQLAVFGELRLIERIRKRLFPSANSRARQDRIVEGIGDDAAVLRFDKGRNLLLLTCDTLVETVHFLKGTPPRRIGWKAMASNLSDIAAMGGIPRYALVSLACPATTKVAEIDAIYSGMTEVADRFGVTVVGGDTVESPRALVITVAVSGEVEEAHYVTRGGARPGDILCVTGTLGGSLLGKHLTFLPRVEEGRFLATKLRPTAMIDISDGLASDLMKMMQASRTTAQIFAKQIPVSEEAIRLAKRKRRSPVEMALNDGEDFELLFTLPEEKLRRCITLFQEKFSTPITVIGKVKKGRGKPTLVHEDGTIVSIRAEGYEHFRKSQSRPADAQEG